MHEYSTWSTAKVKLVITNIACSNTELNLAKQQKT